MGIVHLDVELDAIGQPCRVGTVRLSDDSALRAAIARHALPSAAVEAVLARWREAGRWYHAQWHLNDLFGRAARSQVPLGLAQVLALLYHDVVYVPGAPAGTNEALSVLVLRQAAFAADWPPDIVRAAGDMIEDTAGHRPRSVDSARVIALDLATLGDEPQYFDAWTELVWREYRHLFSDEPDPFVSYLRRRVRVLRGLLESTRVGEFPGGFHERFSANLDRLERDIPA